MSRCLILNLTYEPLGFLDQNSTICLIYEDKVEIIEAEDREYRSPSGYTIPAPLVVRLKKYIRVPRNLREGISSKALFARDGHKCQYCGRHESELKGKRNRLTVDHVLPKSKGGPHQWENVVTSCYYCNIKKRDRTPLQANMKLVDLYKDRSPKKPNIAKFYWSGKCLPQQQKWIDFYYKEG